MQEKNKNKIYIIVLIIIVVLIILLSIITKDNKDNNLLINNYVSKLTIKDFKDNNYSCDIKEILDNNNIPYFNLNNQLYQNINNEILTNFFLKTCYQNGNMDYEISLNNEILSLVLTINYEEADDINYDFKTYNIDLKNHSLINNEYLLKKYNSSLEKANNLFMSKLSEYYNYEKDHSDNNLSYSDFLQKIEYESITNENINLFIDTNNNLYMYKTYKVTELMALDENYPELITTFKLT